MLTINLRYYRRYFLYFFIVLVILLIQFLLALSFYATSNQFDSQFNHISPRENFKSTIEKFASNSYDEDDDNRQSSSHSFRERSNSKQSTLTLANEKYQLKHETLNFKLKCNLTSKDAIFAINRATSDSCKEGISNIACLIQEEKFYPKFLPNLCPFDEVRKNTAIIDKEDKPRKSIRIAFILILNGRAVRQIVRLLKLIYSESHIYLIHVDKRQNYLYNRLKDILDLPNVHFTENRLSTIWGGASLLQMLFNAFNELLTHSQWEYVINLSESDFPVKSLNKLESFLADNRGFNFVKSHGQSTTRFLAKQGLDKTFLECDNHMWRIGDRHLPHGIRMDGGSDWIALTRHFVKYLMEENDQLLIGLRKIFRYTLLPAESFFHTVLRNSRYCDTVIENNLHTTNWKRKQGCKCQYKHIVDWCGCSPNVFKLEDWPRIYDTRDKPLFFGRKFEAVINQAILNRIERWVLNETREEFDSSSLRYWQNIYHSEDRSFDDGRHSVSHVLAIQSLQRINGMCRKRDEEMKYEGDFYNLAKLKVDVRQSMIYIENDEYQGDLVSFDVRRGDYVVSSFEVYTRPIDYFVVHQNTGPVASKLIEVKACSDYDQKEQVFRNFDCVLHPFSEISVRHVWSHKVNNFSVTFVWIDPANNVAGSFEVKIETPISKMNNLPLVMNHKPTFELPLRPGIWKFHILYKWAKIAETKFLVSPFIFEHGEAILKERTRFFHNGPKSGKYLDHNFTSVENLLGLSRERNSHEKIAIMNSDRWGNDLVLWTAALISQFWSIRDICVIDDKSMLPCLSASIEYCHITRWSSFSIDQKSSPQFLFRPVSE